jgi:hypothetical protein
MLEDHRRVAGGDLGGRWMDTGAAPGAPADGDERLGLEDAERLAQRRPRDAELAHEDVLGRQRVAVLQFAADDAVADMLRHDLRRLGHSDCIRPFSDLLVPHGRHYTS